MTDTLIPETRTSPYQGLRNFDEEDAEFFFGRDRERDVIIANLKATRLTVVYGPSGVGKTSLLRAGVEASLVKAAARSHARLGTPEFVPVVFSAWQDDPSAGLANAIARQVEHLTEEPMPAAASLADTITLAANRTEASLLVILDQFEDLALYHEGKDGTGSFEAEFPRLVNDRRLPVNFLISIREDALAQLDRFRAGIPELLDTLLRVQPLSGSAAREAITAPLARYNDLAPPEKRVMIEDELVVEVLHQVRTGQVAFEQEGHGRVAPQEGADGEVQGGQIEAPYLQLVMATVWDYEMRHDSHTLRRATLVDKLGGAEEIVRTHLDKTLGDLPPEQRETAIDVLDHLVTPSGTKIALRIPDLAFYSERPSDQVEALVESLSSGPRRILRPVPLPAGHDGTPGVEIFHDVLAPAILAWRTRQAALRIEHEKHAAEKQARTERARVRRFKMLASGAIGLLVVAIVAVVFAEIQRGEAKRAERAALSGRSEGLAAQAALQLQDRNLSQAVLLSIEAYRTAPTAQAVNELATVQEKTLGMVAYLKGQSAPVNAVAISPDGHLVASGSVDTTVVVWNIATGRLLHVLRGHTAAVNAVAFSPDGRLLASGSSDGTVLLSNVATGASVGTLAAGGMRQIYSIAFSPDGRTLAAAESGGVVVRWDLAAGRALGVLRAGGAAINGVAFSPNGRMFATGGGDGAVALWNAVTGQRMRALGRGGAPVNTVAFSPNGSELASAGDDRTIRLWDVATGRLLYTLRGHTAGVNAVAFSPNGKQLASGGDDHMIGLWDVATGQLIRFVGDDTGSVVESVAFSPDGRTLASGSDDASVVLWNPALSGGFRSLTDPRPTPVYGVAFSPNGRLLAVAGENGSVVVWNSQTDQVVRSFDYAGGSAYGIAFSPTGNELAAAYADGSGVVWDLASQRSRHLAGDGEPLYAVAFAPDGRTLAVGGASGSVILWNANTGARLRDLPGDRSAINSVAFSPDGSTLAAGGADDSIALWNPSNGRRLATLSGHTAPVNAVAFSPDGKTLLSGSDDDTVIQWDPTTGQERGEPLQGHLNAVLSVAFSPDGKTIASGSEDNTAILWRAASRLGVPLGGHTNFVTSVAFSPDGQVLATGSVDATVALFRPQAESAEPHAIYARLCSVVRRNLTASEWHEFLPGRAYQRTCPAYR